jgi:uncharacterized SAM-binding protein YcdF (DUF218 family)
MRNRGILIIILPVIVFLWFVGWSLYWLGSRSKLAETDNSQKEGLEMVVALYEEAMQRLDS